MINSLQNVTGGGSFTRQNISDINNNFQAVSQPNVWVRPQDGNNNGRPSVTAKHGSFDNAFATMAGLANVIEPGLVIGLQGVLREEYSSPIVNDVSIVAPASNLPRQATSNGVPNGGGATWLSPTGGTGCLLTVNGQAWRLQGLFFNNSATAAPGVRINNVGDPPTQADGAWTLVKGCQFNGADDGLSLMGGGGVEVIGNRFIGFSVSGDKALITEAGAGGGTGSWARILHNDFVANLTHIQAVAHNWEIAHNHFTYINAGVTTTAQVLLAGGSNNSVHDNYFDLPHNTNGISAMFSGGTNDRWYFNKFSTVVATDIFAFGVPAT